MTDPAQGEPDAPTEPVDVPATNEPASKPETDWKAEARKWEDRAKQNSAAADELAALRKQTETDLERAVREAEERGRTTAMSEVGIDRVADAFRVAAAGRDIDVDDLLDVIDASKFLGADGQPDREAITARVQKLAPERDAAPPDLGQGARGGEKTPGLNSSQLQRDLEKALGI